MHVWTLLVALTGTLRLRQARACLQTNGRQGLPFFQGYKACELCPGGPNRRIHHQHQAIIPSYKFNCCGNITEWGVDLNPLVPKFNFDFQVWRPSSTMNETGCYSLVGNYAVRSTTVSTGPVSNQVIRATPSPQNQLQFQPGDVLGFYVESHGSGTHEDNGVVLLNNGKYTSELVWYGSIDVTARTSQSGSCPYPVGTGGVLSSPTHAAPVISISVMTTSCFPNYSSLGPIGSTSLPNPTRIRGPTTEPELPHFTKTNYAKVPGSLSSGIITGLMVVILVVVIMSVICIIVIIAIITSPVTIYFSVVIR